jgi:hypothetical protein
LTLHSAGASVPVTIPFPVLVVPGSAVLAVRYSPWSAAAGRARFPSFYPVKLAKKIDELAKKAKVAIVGTGLNPRFVMDALQIKLIYVCERVDSIRIDRIQGACVRWLPFKKKIGSGLTVKQFLEKVDAGAVGHVGLTEVVAMIADAFGWKVDRITDTIQPKIAEQQVSSLFQTVEPGFVCGLIQDGIGCNKEGKPPITLHMEPNSRAPESYDARHGRAVIIRR